MGGVDWSVIIGFVGLIVVIVGAVIARDRAITNTIHTNHEAALKESNDGDDKLHSRINDVRETMTNGYVRRDDLDGHLQRIEKGVTELRTEMREERRDTNTRLDAVLSAISNKSKSG